MLDFFGTPVIDHQGNVAFLAESQAPVTPPVILNRSVWMRGADGQRADGLRADGLHMVARSGQAAPGTAETFISLGRPRIAQGRISFDARITWPNSFGIGASGVWTDRHGAVERVLLGPVDHPSMTSPGSVFVEAAEGQFNEMICEDGTVMIGGRYNDGALPHPGVAVRHMPAPGTEPGVVFDESVDVAFDGPIDNWWANAGNGHIALVGYLGGPRHQHRER